MADSGQARVIFQPSGRRGSFAIGTPVLDAARALGVYVESVCGGRGICGRCQISVCEGTFAKEGLTSAADHLAPASDAEARYAALRPLADRRRLGCQARILGDLVVDVPSEAQTNRQIVRKRAEARRIDPDPAVSQWTVSVAEPDMETPRGDADRLREAVAAAAGLADLSIDPPLLPRVQAILRKGGWTVTAAVYRDASAPVLIDLWPGGPKPLYGLAVDIGSTTIAAHLCDLASGRTVASAGTSNPQIRFGEDLMSRVSYVQMNPSRLPELTRVVRDAINALIGKLVGDVDAQRSDVLDAAFVGNPVMHHLFLGIDPTELGGAPFALAVSDAFVLPTRDLDLDISLGGRVYMLPCIAGHVGADAAAATLSEAPYASDEITLLVDIGTNAEIVLGSRDRLLAASSPTGPAFEGAEISCGQRAAPGAIERVRIDRETLEPRFKVIGVDDWSDEAGFADRIDQVGVTGICGSGIIEVVAEMFLCGLITEDGVIDGALAERTPRIVRNGRTFSYVLVDEGIPISVTQTDIRSIQLAKAALYAGVKLLQDRLGFDRIDRIRLAGAFGSYIDPRYAMVIGLIPDCDLAHVGGVGNAAGTGARMALLNRQHRREVEETVRRIEKIETALEPRFQEHFVNAMALPNKVDPFDRLRAEIVLPPPSGLPGEDGEANGRRRRRRR
ncbi:ASKHA domain-containing protein [Polymorphum gilvum]|uniref:Probable electron transfer protein n=1 Tax=Polymorphum gilvum (strain LMG 25793 / CGMCC 1.9160 / SL003B-26A1) TaxID=991905 RepID=F2J5U7_POLGS|nr:ASKHA domain-containing protein [Polymorphum gilvum]ADZ71201.1 Probable electron transfer protein [Polymorphum gilvum SL003B-26A1]